MCCTHIAARCHELRLHFFFAYSGARGCTAWVLLRLRVLIECPGGTPWLALMPCFVPGATMTTCSEQLTGGLLGLPSLGGPASP